MEPYWNYSLDIILFLSLKYENAVLIREMSIES
jgi:hypothetical protein